MSNNFPIVDRALAYYCPYTGEVYILVIKNLLQAPSIDYELMPLLIMRARGVAINDVPKMYYEDPIVNDHRIYFEHFDMWIIFQLNGVFVCFNTRVLTEREINECEKLFLNLDYSD